MKTYFINKLVLSILCLGIFGLSSCSKKTDSASNQQNSQNQTTKTTNSSTTSEANTSDVNKVMSDMMGGSTATHKSSAKAIAASTLVQFLPSISGFESQNPQKMEMNFQGTSYSFVSQDYKSGDKEATIAIYDYNYITGLTAAYSAMMSMNMETNDEIMKSEKFGSYPGWVDWKKNTNDGTVGIVVNDRIFVIVESKHGMSQSDLTDLANKIDLNGIARAAS